MALKICIYLFIYAFIHLFSGGGDPIQCLMNARQLSVIEFHPRLCRL
jgi:hypothetical protein